MWFSLSLQRTVVEKAKQREKDKKEKKKETSGERAEGGSPAPPRSPREEGKEERDVRDGRGREGRRGRSPIRRDRERSPLRYIQLILYMFNQDTILRCPEPAVLA